MGVQLERPAAIVGGETVTWSDLAPALAEAAGGPIVEEVALDRLLRREMTLRGLTLAPDAIQKEQELIAQTVAQTAGVDAASQGDLVLELRRTRGLGEQRFAMLLRRNAMLRLMVRDEVVVSAEDVRQAHEIRYGQRFQTRIVLVRTERDAADAMARLRGEGRPKESFGEVAGAVSIDPSRFRGGLLGAISPADPSYPLAIRRAVTTLAPGALSPVIALDQGYAIVGVDEVIPATGTDFESVAASLEREVRLLRERVSMDRLASQLLRAANITVLHPSLDWSWRTGNRGGAAAGR